MYICMSLERAGKRVFRAEDPLHPMLRARSA